MPRLTLPLPVRKLLADAFGNLSVRIRGGRNRGSRWSLTAAGRYRQGTFETERVETIMAFLEPGDCFWDMGAHHGYVSLAASRQVGEAGHVYSFEPSRYNFAQLSRHMAWNDCKNVVPLNVGMAGAPGESLFGGDGSSLTFTLRGGAERVPVTSVVEMLEGGARPPNVLKIDVEGAEGEILRAGAAHLPTRAVAIVSIHSRADYDEVVDALQAANFAVSLTADMRERRDGASWGAADPDLIAVGPDCGSRWDDVLGAAGFSPID